MSRSALILAGLAVALTPAAAAEPPKTHHKTVKVGDLDIFYREAGPKDAPVVLLLHGFPTSSQMFRNLIPQLADKYRVIAPDYPGFGQSSMPARDKFVYTFDNLADVVEKFTEKLDLKKYALYLQDYGAPVGYRLASKHPERITAIVVQNGNATTRASTTTSGSRSRRTGRSRRARTSGRRFGASRNSKRPSGSTRTGSRTPNWCRRMPGRRTSTCSTALGTPTSSLTCS